MSRASRARYSVASSVAGRASNFAPRSVRTSVRIGLAGGQDFVVHPFVLSPLYELDYLERLAVRPWGSVIRRDKDIDRSRRPPAVKIAAQVRDMPSR